VQRFADSSSHIQKLIADCHFTVSLAGRAVSQWYMVAAEMGVVTLLLRATVAFTTPEGAYRGKPKASKALNFLLTRQGLTGKPESLPTLPAPCQLYEACLGFSGQGLDRARVVGKPYRQGLPGTCEGLPVRHSKAYPRRLTSSLSDKEEMKASIRWKEGLPVKACQ
jgi:hypothetical protein